VYFCIARVQLNGVDAPPRNRVCVLARVTYFSRPCSVGNDTAGDQTANGAQLPQSSSPGASGTANSGSWLREFPTALLT